MATKKNKKKAAKATNKTAGDQSRNISQNRKATHRYEITEQIECGVVLKGGADIPEYKQATIWNHEPKRSRKLLVHAEQFRKLSTRALEKGLTLIPLRLYFNQRGIVKLMVGVGRGKKLHDKRESLKKADVKRQISRAMRDR